jgi:hypothetical protein
MRHVLRACFGLDCAKGRLRSPGSDFGLSHRILDLVKIEGIGLRSIPGEEREARRAAARLALSFCLRKTSPESKGRTKEQLEIGAEASCR